MSTPKSERSQKKFVTIRKAYEFASFTHKICSNENVFLKRNRWCSTYKIVETVDDIAIYCEQANETDIKNKEEVALRLKYIEKAISLTIKAETLMEIVYRDNNREKQNLTDEKFENWIGLLLEIRNLLFTWKKVKY